MSPNYKKAFLDVCTLEPGGFFLRMCLYAA